MARKSSSERLPGRRKAARQEAQPVVDLAEAEPHQLVLLSEAAAGSSGGIKQH